MKRSNNSFRNFAVKKPVLAFLAIVLPLSWISLFTLSYYGLPNEPGLLIMTYGGLLGMSILITYWLHGRNGVKQLLQGVIHWRVAPGYYVIALLAVPLLTLLLSLLIGTFRQPPEGWAALVWNYSLSLITGVLIINLWEELGWTGFVQNRLMQYKGLLHGSLLTAPGFVAIHIPLIFDDPNLTVVLTDFIAVVVLSIFFRYLLGMIFLDTQGSILIVGLLHASQSSANDLEAVTGEYGMILAVIILTLIIAVYRVMRGKSAVSGSLPELHVKNKRKID